MISVNVNDVAATASQNKRQRHIADDSSSPVNGRMMMHQTDMIQQQRNENIYSSVTSSPESFYRPSSALRNSPSVYVVFRSNISVRCL